MNSHEKKSPLLVHLVFHPDSENARDIAVAVHKSLNLDPLVPGLDIPTTFCNLSLQSPPKNQGLDRAERSFVVVLADDYLVAGEDSEKWHQFVKDLWIKCHNSNHRFIPIQLSKSAWGFDQTLSDACVSFGRAFHEVEDSKKSALVCRTVATELALYLLNQSIGTDQKTAAPFKLFISHAKQDLELEPKVVHELVNTLTADKPLKAWVDSGDIPVGDNFAERIEKGIKESSVLVVLTDNYASREWCRTEVLLAKEHQRPIVVADALQEYEVRSFPYLGNVPVVRWVKNEPYRVLDLVVKESIRQIYTRMFLERWRLSNESILVRPPELATIGSVRGSTFLYPDPPLGFEELKLLEGVGVHATTPLQRLARQSIPHERRVAISMSESSDIAKYGFDNLHLENAIAEIARYLLIQGIGLSYGGHLEKNSFTEVLFDMVRAHNQRDRTVKIKPIRSYSGWPLPEPSIQDKARLSNVGDFRRIGRPSGIDELLHADFVSNPQFFPASKSPEHRLAWSLGMTNMRQIQVSETNARIVLGGKTEKYMSRIPGVLEEVYLSVTENQPVFLIGAFGGAAAMIIDLVMGKHRAEATWDCQKAVPHSDAVKKLYESRGLRWIDYPEIIEAIRKKGASGINTLLSEAENLELFETIDMMRMIELVIKGISRVDA